MSEPEAAPEDARLEAHTLVLDTSAAVKFYVPEEGHEEALKVLSAAESGNIELLAPATLLPEAFNAVWQYHRRGEFTLDEVRTVWSNLERIPVVLYAPEDLISRAGEMTAQTGVIVYDALFLALAEGAGSPTITADERLLRSIKGTDFADLARPLADASTLIPRTG